MHKPNVKSLILFNLVLGILFSFSASSRTKVLVETNLGDVNFILYDDLAPLTVENFLSYVLSGAYDRTIIQRSIAGFVMQSGGYRLTETGDFLLETVEKDTPVINEFSLSNKRATIAMAKIGGDPNSATSEWFINLADNSANLDNQNEGFTVFGEVEDMTVVDAIAQIDTINFGGAFGNLPLTGLTVLDGNTGSVQVSDVKQENFITIKSMTVVPEPSSVLLAVSGLGVLFIRRQR